MCSSDLEMSKVTMGPQIDRDWIVESGLEAGDRVALDGLQRLKSGMKVRVRGPAADADGA